MKGSPGHPGIGPDSVFWCGLAFAFAGFLAVTVGAVVPAGIWLDIPKTLARDVGIGAITGGAITLVTKYFLIGEVFKEFKIISRQLDSRLTGGLSLIKAAEYSAIVGIFAPRREGPHPEIDPPLFNESSWADAIARQLKDTAWHGPDAMVRVQGRSAANFLSAEGLFAEILEEQRVGDCQIKYHFLILNPYSRAGKAIKQSEGRESVNLSYTVNSLLFLAGIRADLAKRADSRFKIDARFYSFGDMAFCVVTEKFAFVEQYHLGESFRGVVGGQVPVFQYRRPTADEKIPKVYNMIHRHFEFLWDGSTNKFEDLEALLEGLDDADQRGEKVREYLMQHAD